MKTEKMTTDVTKAFEAINTAKPSPEVRTCRRIEVGFVVQQGDCYLHRVKDSHPHGSELGTRQVAVGTTIGSRHVVEGEGVSVFAGTKLPPGFKEAPALRQGSLLGPVVVADEPFVLTHPEHAHHRLPVGVYQVTYQADFVSMRAVVD